MLKLTFHEQRKDRLSKAAGNTLVLKTHVQGYVKQDGTYVAPHEDKRPPAKQPVEPGPIYYSKLERLLEAKMPARGTKEQIQGILNSGGVSKEEIEWSQVLDYIEGYTEDGQKHIEKDHLLRFLREQRVTLGEKVLGRSGVYDEWERQRGTVYPENNVALRELFDLATGRPTVQVNVKKLTGPLTEFEPYLRALPKDMHEPAIRFRETDARLHWLDQQEPPRPDGDTKFSQWRLPGGKNYQERLLILPADENGSLPLGYRVEQKDNGKWTVWTDKGIELGTWPTRESAIKSQRRQAGAKLFESTHFDEPNIVVHIRHDDRTGSNGEKILFIEEAQSDWHQQGKKNGYRLPSKELERLDTRRQELEAIGIKKRDKGEDVPEAIKQEWADIMNRLQPYNTARVPDAPFKKDWHELGMKRMLREAAEKGYDILAWVSGRITSDRYDLSKHIAQVHTFKQLESSPYSTLVAIDHHGKNIIERQVSDDQIADYVGKDAADKLVSQNWTSNRSLKLAHKGRYARSISGLDLKIGGEWAINLYDKMIPQFMNKFTKKWDGRVQRMTIKTPPVKTDDPETTAIDEDGHVDRTIHALHITPTMREALLKEGVPLFKSVPPSTVPFPVNTLTVKPGLKGSGYKIDYKTTFQGLPITIENRKGSLRHWGNPDDGTAGTTKMEYPYGYIRMTEGMDGDHVDCFLGPHPQATHAYIVHQAKAPDFVQHDEDKVMLGWDSPEDAAAAYLRHYTNPRFLGSMTGMPMAEFKMKVAWTKDRPGIIKSLLTRFRLFWKAAGDERWITVHPHGAGTEGQPVKIRESAGSPGTWHVVGGAGGQLNYLRLTGVKSHEEYKAQAKDRAKEKRAKAKAQLERDKELGLVESKKRVLSELRTDTEKHQRALIEQVANLKGWQDYDLKPEQLDGLSDRAKQAAILKHHRKLHRDALAVVRATRENLLLNAEARAEANLGELSIHRDEPNVLGLTDLSPDPKDRGLGYQPDYGPKSEDILEEAKAFKDEQAAARDPKKQAALGKMQEVTKETRDEVDKAVESGKLSFGKRDTSPVEDRKAVQLLAAHKQTQATLKQIQARTREVKGATQEVQGKSYVIEAEPVSAQEVLQGLMQDAAERTRQDRAVSFLKMVEHDPFEEQPEESHAQLTRHIQAGSASMLSRISQQLTGVDILPREAVDVLGTAGASQALALALHTHFSPDQIKTWAEQLAAYHAENQGAVTEEAIGRAKEAYEQAQDMVVTSAESPSDLAVVNELNEQRITLLRQAREALGTTLGELEAMAAMQYALTATPATETMVSMGGVSTETAIRQLKALGLEKHDYDIDSDGTNHFALISAEGLGKVVRPIDPEEVQHLKTVDAILDGEHDEAGWVPHGFAQRPTSSYTDPEERASTYAQPYQYSPQGAHDEDLKRYIGRRMADGHPIHEIYKDLSAGTVLDHLPEDQHEAYFQAFNRVAPLYDERGNAQLADAHRATWERYAEEVLKDQYGDHALPIHRQGIQTDSPKTLEAIHRVMAEDPTRSVAFTNIGDLTPQEQATLRHVFEARFAKHENQEALQQAMEELGPEPAKETDGLFGTQENPEWHQYHNKRAAMLQEARANGLNWDKYVALHGSRERAYHAIQDILKGETTAAFQKAYGQVHKTALKLGRTTISNHLSHIDAVNPEARESRLAQHRELVDRLRNRIQGKYSAGSVQAKLERVREESALLDQNQRSMFGVEPDDASVEKPLEADERHTLGHTVESQLAALWPQVARNFDPQRPVNLMVDKRMDGKYVGQQRAIKLIEHNKRMALALGTGSGKSSIMLGAFTHLHDQGKAKKAIFSVPSIVQAQFGAEAAANLEPGKYSWWGKPGADRDERIGAMKDPSHHMVITTHQALRDDLVHLMAKQKDMTDEDMAEQFKGMSENDRATLMQETMKAEGITPEMFAIDEGHDALNRTGKPDSLLSNVLDAFHGHLPYYISSSADPMKNDLSELYSQLHKIDPQKFHHPSGFMSKYGVQTNASMDVLRRELRRYLLPGKVDPGVQAIQHEDPVALTEAQQTAYEQVMADFRSAREAHQNGKLDLPAAKRLSPSSFEGQEASTHEHIAKGLHENLGIVRDGALERVLNDHDPSENAKVQHVVQLANQYREQKKPGIIFARSRKAVDHITQQLARQGHRVLSLTGSDTAKEKAKKIAKFRPPPGREAEADIMVLSDAGATGANLQRGQWIAHYDIPHTSKTWHQRTGRIHRLGQQHDVHVHTLITDTRLDAKKQQRINRKHGLRAQLTAPYESLSDHHDLYTLLRTHDDT